MNSVASGAAINIGLRWLDRLIGVASTLILARLLVPDDFGIIAMASLVIALTDVFLDLGVNVALIQIKDAGAEHFDTAWTLRLIQSTVAFAVLFVAAPFAATYFVEPRLTLVIQVLSASLLLSALENIGIVSFQKEMQFGREFRFLISKRLIGFVATVVAAWSLHSYWGMVIGTIVGKGFGVALSYAVHSMRPRPCLKQWRSIFGVSQWMIIRNLSQFLETRLHEIAVGRRSSTPTFGAYSFAGEIAAMPSTELLAPIGRVLFPAFVRVRDDPAELKRVFLLALGIQAMVALPASTGLVLVAKEAVPILLGERWAEAIPFVQILAAANLVPALAGSAGYVMLAFGSFRRMVAISWIQIAAFSALAFAAFPAAEAETLAWIRLAASSTALLATFYFLGRIFPIVGIMDLVRAILRPGLGVLIMSIVLLPLGHMSSLGAMRLLILKIAIGAGVYVCTVVGLWILAGRQSGPEAYLLNLAREHLTRRRSS